MGRDDRQKLIAELEKERGGNLVISYITSTRQNFEIQIADDILPILFRHLQKHTDRARKEWISSFTAMAVLARYHGEL